MILSGLERKFRLGGGIIAVIWIRRPIVVKFNTNHGWIQERKKFIPFFTNNC